MNHPYPCWASMDEARHAQAEGEREDAAEYWSREATITLHRQMQPQPGDTWFTESVRGGKTGLLSMDEILSEAIYQEDPAIMAAYSNLMRSEHAKPLRDLMEAFWDGLKNAENAAWLAKTTPRRDYA